MALDPQKLAQDMLAGAAATAQGAWTQIQQSATIELQSLAHTLALIVEGTLAGDLSQDMAARHFQTARFHVIATIAMLTELVQAAVEKIVNGALAAIKSAVNSAAGFALL